MTGPPRDFADWYRANAARITRAVWAGCRNDDVAVEAVADACARAYQKWDRVGLMENPDGWVYVSAMRLARRRSRLAGRSVPTTAVAQVDPSDAERVAVRQAIAALPARMRTAIGLRYLLDLSEADVAAAMGVSRGGASALLTKARKRLADQLRADDVTSGEPAGADAAAGAPLRPRMTGEARLGERGGRDQA